MQKELIEKLYEEALDKSELLFNNRRYKESEIILLQLIKVDPENFKALQLLGLYNYKKGDNNKAIEFFEESLKSQPDNSENYNNLSLCYAKLGKIDEAKRHIEKAISLSPENASYLSNFGMHCRQAGDTEKAIDCYKKALDLEPESYIFWMNLGSAYGSLKKLDEAIECFEKSIEINDSPAAHVDLAYAHHLKGNMQKGWEEYEYRLKYFPQLRSIRESYDQNKRIRSSLSSNHALIQKGKSQQQFMKPNSALLDGKKVVVYSEQGLGDLIQFSRFISKFENLNCEVVVKVPKGMENLFDFKIKNVTVTSEEVKEYDYHCSIMSLPHVFRLGNEIGMSDSVKISENKNIDLGNYSDFFKVGIVWAGNPQHPNDLNRSCPLRFFRPISELPNVKLFSLQKDLRKRAYPHHPEPIDLAAGAEGMRVVDMSEHIETFEDTASIIRGLDLVISVDTATLHLAGAMGKETWALLSFNPDWRWKLDDSTTDWYPNMKLFRQDSPSDWEGLVKKVCENLTAKL
jgi:tetratricopeptide (TPR) repeat protein